MLAPRASAYQAGRTEVARPGLRVPRPPPGSQQGNQSFPKCSPAQPAPHPDLGGAAESVGRLFSPLLRSDSPRRWPQDTVRASLWSSGARIAASQIPVGAALFPPPLGGERLAADPERLSVGEGAGRRAPRQTPGLRRVSAGSDALAPGCAAGGGGGAKVFYGPGGQSLAFEAPPSVPTSIPQPLFPHRVLAGATWSRAGALSLSTAKRGSPLHRSVHVCIPSPSSFPPGWAMCLSPTGPWSVPFLGKVGVSVQVEVLVKQLFFLFL